MDKPPFRVIGDVHAFYNQYLPLAEQAEYSVQLGDMGFHYGELDKLDPTRHRFVPGNHDNYDKLPPHAFQSDWGQVSMGGIDFLYIRGAYSIDKARRLLGVSWWEQEQITWESGIQLMETIQVLQPKYILSHDCPGICMDRMGKEMYFGQSITSQILDAVLQYWQPDVWIFGHHHKDWTDTLGKTRFVCLNILSHLDLYPEKGEMVLNG